jgi:HK97 gp10 family phage protein
MKITPIGLTAAEIAQIQRALQIFEQVMGRALDAAGARTAREMRARAPKWLTTLTNSIRMSAPAPLVRVIAPGVDYARYVDEGTGPAAGRARYRTEPPVDALIPWIKDHFAQAGAARRQLRWAKAGSQARDDQESEVRYRAGALARHLRQYGSKPQPFVLPTVKAMQPQVQEILARGVSSALAQIAGRAAG